MAILTATNAILLALLIFLCSIVNAMWVANAKTLAAIAARPRDFSLDRNNTRTRRRRQASTEGAALAATRENKDLEGL
jgi:hypothetical protein